MSPNFDGAICDLYGHPPACNDYAADLPHLEGLVAFTTQHALATVVWGVWPTAISCTIVCGIFSASEG
jgi:hypothetical protein